MKQYPPAGIILFAHNVGTRADLKTLISAIHNLPGQPFVAIDHEGGPVNRLSSFLGNLPSPEEYASLSSREIETMAYSWGQDLKDLGFDVNFAPAVDLGPAQPGSGLERRLLGEAPDDIILKAGAFIAGMDRAGIQCCLKHFPGLGGSRLDTHHSLPEVTFGKNLDHHLSPFRKLHAMVPWMMVSHARYPELDPQGRPASLSPPILSLPRKWGYQGALISDDLEMGALSGEGSIQERAERSFDAGCDLLIISHAWEELPATVEALSHKPREVLAERIERVRAVRMLQA